MTEMLGYANHGRCLGVTNPLTGGRSRLPVVDRCISGPFPRIHSTCEQATPAPSAFPGLATTDLTQPSHRSRTGNRWTTPRRLPPVDVRGTAAPVRTEPTGPTRISNTDVRFTQFPRRGCSGHLRSCGLHRLRSHGFEKGSLPDPSGQRPYIHSTADRICEQVNPYPLAAN